MKFRFPLSILRLSRWIAIARAAWVIVTLLAVTLFIVGLPILYDEYHTLSIYDEGDRNEAYANLAQLGLSVDFYAGYHVALGIVLVAACLALATLICVRKSDEPIALFVALTLVLLGTTFWGPSTEPETLHPVLSALNRFLGSLLDTCILLFFFLFPDGRFVPRWTRWLGVLLIVWLVLMSFPDSPLYPENWPEELTLAVLVGWVLTGGIAQVYRYRRVSGPPERQQTKWVITGFIFALAGLVALRSVAVVFSLLRPGSLADLLITAAVYCFMLLIPLSIAVAILRYRLWDIDIIINRTLVYGALTTSVVGIYMLLVGSLGTLLQTQGNFLVSLLAAGVVAVLFAPLRDRLQRGVNRLMYGERDDPYGVLSRLGKRLEATLAPRAVLPTIVETVAGALKLPYAAIAIKQGAEFKTAAAYGSPGDESTVLPLVYQGETIGQLILAPRAPGEAFTPADMRLLEDLARNAEVAVHAVRLTSDLQRSRERLVTAREEERRRLRRDLHDGVGPTLAGLTFGLDAARSALSRQPEAAEALLVDLKSQTQAAVSDIRRLVYGLRPPALDDLGLVPAIRQQAENNGILADEMVGEPSREQGPIFSVEAPEQLPPLPAAVEVACYRITQEAMINVSRHARARHCRVRLSVDDSSDALEIEVTDDGVGLPEDRRSGVGLSSMRERTAELGGSCSVEVSPAGGTVVLASLPLPEKETPSSHSISKSSSEMERHSLLSEQINPGPGGGRNN
jgi:signal transduction histidine kinase